VNSLYTEVETISQYYDHIGFEAEQALGKYLKESFERLKPIDMVRSYIAIDHKEKPLAKVFFGRYLLASRYITETRYNMKCSEDVVNDLAEYFKNKELPKTEDVAEKTFQQLLLEHVQKNGVNIVVCPHCHQVFLVEIGQKEHVCIACKTVGRFESIKLEES